MSTEEAFCLWDEWYDIEEELAGVSSTVRVQHDAMKRAVSRGCSKPAVPSEALPERNTSTPKTCLVVAEGGAENVHKKESGSLPNPT